MLGRQQTVEVDVHERRIAVMMFAIGERALQCFQHEVDVVGTVLLQPVQASGLQDQQRLSERRALAPGAARQQLELAPSGDDRP